MTDLYRSNMEREYAALAFPITCESYDIDGAWILVELLRWLGKGKWLALDEDGHDLIVDSSHLRNPRM